jgi:hypothetical protein
VQYILQHPAQVVAHLNAIPVNYIDSTWPLFVRAKLAAPQTKIANPVHRALVSEPKTPAVSAMLPQIIPMSK